MRALAGLRIALGVVILLDLALRARDLVAFYTDDGVVPRSVLAEMYPVHPNLSLHALSGDAWFQMVLFLIAGAFAVALVLGYRTRLVTAVSLIFLVSLHARNPTVLDSGDVLLRRLLFWGIFLPLGARWSMDAGRETEDRESVATIASLALLTQVVLVYATNALHKVGSDVWFDGEALEYVLKLDQFSVLIGPVIAEFDVLVTALDWFWLVLLFSSWLLLATTGRARGILAVLFIAMHIGMALTLDLGVFPLVSITSLLPFLPAPLWDRVDDLTLPQAIPGIARLDSSAGQTESVFPIGDSSHGRRLRVGIHGVLLALLLVSNAVSIGLIQAPEGTPEELTDSSWTMFAPPPTGESWVVAEGRLANNRTVDVLHGGPVNTDRPPDVDRFPNARWEKHLDRYSRSSELRPALADYLCRRWNDGSETTLENIQFRRVWAPIEPGAPGDTLIVELGHYRCGGEAENEVKSLARVPVDGYS